MFQGGACFAGAAHPGTAAFLTGGAALAGGLALLVGFFTPIAHSVPWITLVAIGIGFSWLSIPTANQLEVKIMADFVAIVAAAIGSTLLGPGALSLDARLFGRREIIIPPPHRVPRP